MLDAYVIDEIKRRERGRNKDVRPTIQLPVPTPAPKPPEGEPNQGDGDRGVVIINYA